MLVAGPCLVISAAYQHGEVYTGNTHQPGQRASEHKQVKLRWKLAISVVATVCFSKEPTKCVFVKHNKRDF